MANPKPKGPVPQMWWGYRHIDGGCQAKRYLPATGRGDLDDAKQSPFVHEVLGPFMAMDRADALELIELRTKRHDASIKSKAGDHE